MIALWSLAIHPTQNLGGQNDQNTVFRISDGNSSGCHCITNFHRQSLRPDHPKRQTNVIARHLLATSDIQHSDLGSDP